MAKNITYIGGRFKSAAKNDPYVAEAKDIIDERIKKDQEAINNDTYRKDDVYNKEETNNIISRTPETDVIVIDTNGTIVVGDIYPHDASAWEMGSLNGDTEVESTVRCRTKDYISIKNATELVISRLNMELLMHVGFQYYDSTKHYIGWQAYTSSATITPIEGAEYIRFLVMPYPDGAFEITPERSATAVTCTMSVPSSLDNIPVEDRPNKLFRIPGPGNTTYSEWAWDGDSWVKLCEKDYGIDDAPIEGSVNMVKSGGIFNQIKSETAKSVLPNANIVKTGSRGNLLDECSWENGTFGNDGKPSGTSSIRIRNKEYIPLIPKELPVVNYESGNYRIDVLMYDKNLSYIGDTLYLNEGNVPLDEDTAYVKFIIRSEPDGEELNPSSVSSFGISIETTNVLSQYIKRNFVYSPMFRPLFTIEDIVNGTILDGGDETDTDLRKRTSDFIPIDPWHRLCFELTNNLWAYSIAYYDSEQHWMGGSVYYTDSRIINPGYRAASYIKLVFKYIPDDAHSIPEDAMNTFGIAVYDIDSINAKEFTDLKTSHDILQKHVDTVTQEGGRFDIFPQNFINATFNGSEIVPNYQRLLSGFVKVNPSTRYLVEVGEDADERLRVAINLFDKDKHYIGWTLYNDGSDFTFETQAAEYILVLVRYNDDSSISPEQFIPYSIKAVDIESTENGYFDTYPICWEYGTINGQGEPSGSQTFRIRHRLFHAIKGGKIYSVKYTDSGYKIDLCLYDKDFNYLGDTLYQENGASFLLNEQVCYFKMLLMPIPDGTTIDIEDAVTSGISVLPASASETSERTEVINIGIGLWNIGLMNHGVATDGRWGIPDADVDATLPSIKNILTNLHADILIIDEYSTYVDRSYTRNSYNELFKQFYPYYQIWGNGGMAVFSKYPLFLEGARNKIEIDDDIPYDLDGRPIYYGNINVRGQQVGIMSCHLSPYSSERRRKEAANICQLMSGYDKCIVAGDMNSDPGAAGFEVDMAPFRTAGYNFGNGGYWGYKNTYNPNYHTSPGEWYIDNILVRGISINFFEVGVDMSISDHLPVKSEVSVLTGE